MIRATVVRPVRRSTSAMSIAAEPVGVADDLDPAGREVEDPPAPGRRRSSAWASTSLGRERRPGGRPPRRVADPGGEVADDQHRDVAEVLELAQLAQHDREAEVDVGGGRVDARASPAAAGRIRAWSRSSGSVMQSTAPAVRIRSCCVHGGHRRTLPARLTDRATREARSGPRVPAWATMCAREAIPSVAVRAGRSSRSSRAGCRYTSDLRLPDDQAVSSQVLWADGTPADHAPRREDREPVALAAMAPSLPKAVVAIEDERFFDHDGVDARGVVRALTHDIEAGNLDRGRVHDHPAVRARGDARPREGPRAQAARGGDGRSSSSTATRSGRSSSATSTPSTSATARTACRPRPGATSARTSRDLDLAQSALLAGLIRAPETYNPYVAPGARRWPGATRCSTGSSSSTGRRRADGRRGRARSRSGSRRAPTDDRYPAPYFVEQVTQFILANKAFGVTQDQRRRLLLEGGLAIHTTLDPKLQGLAEQSAARVISAAGDRPGGGARRDRARRPGRSRRTSAARTTGAPAPWAKVDLADIDCYESGKGCRQAGSTFKPFVLAAALEPGVPLSRTLQRARRRSRSRSPAASRRGSSTTTTASGRGRMNLTEATVNSVNTVYAQLVMDSASQPVVDLAAQDGHPLAAAPRSRRPRSAATARPCSTWRPRTTRSPATGCTPTRCSSPGHEPRRHRALRGAARSAPGSCRRRPRARSPACCSRS